MFCFIRQLKFLKYCTLSRIFLWKLINGWSLIRPCWLDFFKKINRRVDMIIRATKDVFSYEISYITVLTSNFSTLFKFPAVNLPVSLSPSLSLLSYASHGYCNNLSFLIWSWNDTSTPLVIVDHRLGQLLKIYNKVSVEL